MSARRDETGFASSADARVFTASRESDDFRCNRIAHRVSCARVRSFGSSRWSEHRIARVDASRLDC